MEKTYSIGDQVIVVNSVFKPITLEVIDVDGHRTESGQLVRKYWLSDGRHYLSTDLFPTMAEARAYHVQLFEKVLSYFE
ncbi:hypothetical protein [Spirosoma aerophilum]